MMLRVTALACVALSLSACGGLQWPPPQQNAGAAPRSGATAMNASAHSHTVVRGDTLFGVSRSYGIDPYEVARLNNLTPPYNIKVNQTLILPGTPTPSAPVAPSYEIVDRSNSPISSPAPRSVAVERVQIDEIKQPAPLAAPASVAPVSVAASPMPASPVAPPPAREIAAPALSSPVMTETVGRGVGTPESTVRPLSLPVTQPASVQVASAAPEVMSIPATTPIERPATATAQPAQEKTQLASLPPAQTPSSTKPHVGGRFIWPVEGKVMSGFGSKGDGLNNDGINIAAARGTPVYAAAAGVVAYAGNEIRGFGNLLLIQHPDGWMTAYAHQDKLLVKRGDRVQQGQQIGAVGATGNVLSPQLHFEVRRGKRPVDPVEQMVAQRAS